MGWLLANPRDPCNPWIPMECGAIPPLYFKKTKQKKAAVKRRTPKDVNLMRRGKPGKPWSHARKNCSGKYHESSRIQG
jgi:hypothetical protein